MNHKQDLNVDFKENYFKDRYDNFSRIYRPMKRGILRTTFSSISRPIKRGLLGRFFLRYDIKCRFLRRFFLSGSIKRDLRNNKVFTRTNRLIYLGFLVRFNQGYWVN